MEVVETVGVKVIKNVNKKHVVKLGLSTKSHPGHMVPVCKSCLLNMSYVSFSWSRLAGCICISKLENRKESKLSHCFLKTLNIAC